MSDRIESALTQEEWEASRDSDGEGCVRVGTDSVAYLSGAGDLLYVATHNGHAIGEIRDVAKLIALANAALPDSDPRKITRQTVAMLHRAAKEWEEDVGEYMQDMTSPEAPALLRLARALLSYLPPE